MHPEKTHTMTRSGDWTRYWVAADVGGIELLHARFRRHSFLPHTHDDFTLGVIRGGALGFDHERGAAVAWPGCLSLVNPGELHTGFGAAASGWRYRNFFLPAALMRRLVAELGHGDRTPFFPRTVIQDAELAGSLLSLHRLLEHSEDTLERESAVVATLTSLIVRHAVADRPPPPAGEEPRAVRRLVELIEDRYAEKLTLEQMARETDLSRFQLLRLFRRRTGLTPHAYLLQVRVERAKRRLAEGHAIAEVAVDCGFFDQSHLTQRFKRITGVTPGTFARASGFPHAETAQRGL